MDRFPTSNPNVKAVSVARCAGPPPDRGTPDRWLNLELDIYGAAAAAPADISLIAEQRHVSARSAAAGQLRHAMLLSLP